MKTERTPLVLGNWKTNQSLLEIEVFFKTLDDQLTDKNPESWRLDWGIAPQMLHLEMANRLRDRFGDSLSKMQIGAQDCSSFPPGAHTGDCSSESISELGCDFVLIGHSERREFHKESHSLLQNKIERAWKNGLHCIFCIGETLEQKKRKQTNEVLENQLEMVLANVARQTSDSAKFLSVAYEPVWAIGTGESATPNQAQESHLFIRQTLGRLLGQSCAESTRILYGGSVKKDNIKDLLKQQDVDGALVGGASLDAEHFVSLCLSAKKDVAR